MDKEIKTEIRKIMVLSEREVRKNMKQRQILRDEAIKYTHWMAC